MKKSISLKYKIGLMQLGISQRELSNILGYTESYISMVFAGKRQNKEIHKWMVQNVPNLFKSKGITIQ